MLHWKDYSKYGTVVQGTPFVPFKQPFDTNLNNKLEPEDRFRFYDLVKNFPDIGLIIQITRVNKCYHDKVVARYNREFHQMFVNKSYWLPSAGYRRKLNTEFFNVCQEFLKRNPNKLIGVYDYCSVSETAYFIVNYLRDVCGLSLVEAVARFESDRREKLNNPVSEVLYFENTKLLTPQLPDSVSYD